MKIIKMILKVLTNEKNENNFKDWKVDCEPAAAMTANVAIVSGSMLDICSRRNNKF